MTEKLLPEILKGMFDYNPDTGELLWAINNQRLTKGKAAGAIDSKGRIRIEIKGKTYAAHHIAFAIFYGRWPAFQLDHINQIKTDNRIKNLREATNSQNCRNRKSKNPLAKGVSLHKGRYIARIMADGVHHHLGCFDNAEAAAAAYQAAAVKFHGEFACPKN